MTAKQQNFIPVIEELEQKLRSKNRLKEGIDKATEELEQGMLKIDKGNLINDISQGFDTSSSKKSKKRFMCR